MNQQNQQSFPSFIIPWAQPQQSYRSQPQDTMPARVQVAMEYLHQLMIKQMPRAAVNDNNIEWAGDQEFAKELQISLAEIQTREAACDLLTGYFKGELKPTATEKIIAQHLKGSLPETMGQFLECMQCGGRKYVSAGVKCGLCKGSGGLYVYPAGE